MKRVNVHDAETNLLRYLTELAPGETLVKPRIGVARGQFEVPDSFFEPLPDEILPPFSGR